MATNEIKIRLMDAPEVIEAEEESVSDGFGNSWPKYCPDCGAEIIVLRPGKAVCSAECWAVDDE